MSLGRSIDCRDYERAAFRMRENQFRGRPRTRSRMQKKKRDLSAANFLLARCNIPTNFSPSTVDDGGVEGYCAGLYFFFLSLCWCRVFFYWVRGDKASLRAQISFQLLNARPSRPAAEVWIDSVAPLCRQKILPGRHCPA